MTEAILLVGGLGTRLKSEVNDIPKSMAPINGTPFLRYQLDYLSNFGIKRIVLAVGYLSEVVQSYFQYEYNNMVISYSYEEEPIGTGGAIIQAIEKTTTEHVLILNGDTLFQVDFDQFLSSHKNNNADFSLALKPLTNFERYGVVSIDPKNRVQGFEEKKHQKEGNINGGVYIINKSILKNLTFNKKFSFEKEFLEKLYKDFKFNAYLSSSYFLDIGIPSDYNQAQEDFKKFSTYNISNEWTLFLDRDGVINTHIKNGYVTSLRNFTFIEGSLEAISILSKLFNRIVIVTNQQCVGKGIITSNELEQIHEHMIKKITLNNGKVDQVYYAPQLKSENSIYRKPNTGMADQAAIDFPEINFHKSIIVGDSHSDMEFGLNKGMKTVFINRIGNSKYSQNFNSLIDFANSLK